MFAAAHLPSPAVAQDLLEQRVLIVPVSAEETAVRRVALRCEDRQAPQAGGLRFPGQALVQARAEGQGQAVQLLEAVETAQHLIRRSNLRTRWLSVVLKSGEICWKLF